MDSIGFLFLGGMLLVMWLLIIRPQTQAAKKAKEFQDGIEKGSKIVTTGGIHGRISKVDDTTVMLEVGNNTIKIEKSAISLDLTKAVYGETEKKAEAAEVKA